MNAGEAKLSPQLVRPHNGDCGAVITILTATSPKRKNLSRPSLSSAAVSNSQNEVVTPVVSSMTAKQRVAAAADNDYDDFSNDNHRFMAVLTNPATAKQW